MKVVSGDVSDWEDEWQALHLFSAFAFRKIRECGGDSDDGACAAERSASAESGQKPFDLSQIMKLDDGQSRMR